MMAFVVLLMTVERVAGRVSVDLALGHLRSRVR